MGDEHWNEAFDNDGDRPLDDDDFGGIGCGLCHQEGWFHGCCDDMCRGCNEPEDCDNGYPCKNCNPDGELP